MGKKGRWFSAIKRVFTHNSKEKPSYGSDKKSSKEKKTGKGILRREETKSFIPLFREPSSIEKILGEADQLLIRPPASSEEPKTPHSLLWRPESPKAISNIASSPKVASPRSSARLTCSKAPSPRAVSLKDASSRAVLPATVTPETASSKNVPHKVIQSHKEIRYVQRPESTLRNQHHSATKIQAAFRGYLARRNFKAFKGLMRLQGLVRGQNAKRQTINAMKQMQLLVRVQTQIQSRRIQMLENQALLQQSYRNDEEVECSLSKWTSNQLPEAGNNEDWDDSMLTKEEIEARLQKKVEAVVKRERAMAYAYYHQHLWKSNPNSAHNPPDIRSNGFPWWWNWLERQPPPANTSQSQAAIRNANSTPPRPISDYRPSPQLNASNFKHSNFTSDNQEAVMSRSSRSTVPLRAKQIQTPTRMPPPASGSGPIKYSKPTGGTTNSACDYPLHDDDSLTSYPPFSVPNYMAPTVSAKAKVRAQSNPKERLPGTPVNDSKRRFSFSLTTNVGSFKWNKGSSKDSASKKPLEKHISSHSIGDLSIDSTISMPATVGRRPFNRFV